MLMRSKGARIHFDCLGDPEHPTVCFVHSLATDGGMWSEQVGPCCGLGIASCGSIYAVMVAVIRSRATTRCIRSPMTSLMS